MTAVFDLFYLFVENVFGGSLLFTVIGLMVLLALLCMFTKMSILLMSNIVIMFLLIMLIGFFGSIVGVLIFAFSAMYFFAALAKWIRGG